MTMDTFELRTKLLNPRYLTNVPPTPEIDSLSLHDALPISTARTYSACSGRFADRTPVSRWSRSKLRTDASPTRSEEHTSELQSQFHLVCRLLLEKKKICIFFYSSRCPLILISRLSCPRYST